MTATPDFAPLIHRIEGVLERGEGGYAQLPEDRRFGIGVMPTDEPSVLRREAMIKRRAFAMVTHADWPASTEFVNKKDFSVQVLVHFFYWLEDVDRWESLRQVLIDAPTDMLYVRKALCHGGNLDADSEGRETGLNGGAFIDGTWDLDEPDEEHRLLHGTMLLNGSMTFLNPTGS